MFDRIMENSMALWMLASAVFPIFLFGSLIKAFLHFRNLRRLPEYIPGTSLARPRSQTDSMHSEDWVASR